ncbi:MAG: hypothetical protein IKI97_01780 [Clostridia bacterium]|nr:hypothetical protein [Clostridia bacterium]
MGKDKFVITVDEDTQSLIINSLLLMRDVKLKEGLNIDWISETIIDVCNAPKKRGRFIGEGYER